MFEVGWNQAAGLRAEARQGEARLMPVASSAQPARAYEMLCTLAAHVAAMGHHPVIVDGSGQESGDWHRAAGSHMGLLQVLNDVSLAGLDRPTDGSEWLVMPAALGLQELQQTARAAGGQVAVSRLLAPFAAKVVVLLYAPASTLASILSGMSVQVMVPVLPQKQASIDAYAALKTLHAAGFSPVLSPLEQEDEFAELPAQQVVRTVVECARRHLNLEATAWPMHTWGVRVQEAALSGPQTMGRRRNGWGDALHQGALTAQTFWS
ncbi:MAG TPA: hypothetical protein VIN35_04315 [Hydrogenophaga sp.]